MIERQLSVVLVDDDAMVRDWLRYLLDGTEFRLAGEASSAAEARALFPRRLPDLLLVDYRLPDGLGTELVRELRAHRPTRSLVMTANPEPGLSEAARAVGASGTTLKTGRGAEVLAALRAVASGATLYDERHPTRAPGRNPLSRREREALRLVASGSTNREIAAELGVGPETVKTLLARAFAKLGATRRAEAVAAAHRERLL